MKKILMILSVTLLLTAFTGCALFEDKKMETVNITELNIDDNFNFETERFVNVELYALYGGTFNITDMEDNMLFKGKVDANDGFNQKIKMPTRITEVKILFKEAESYTKNYRIRDNEIVHTFVPQYD